MLSSQKRISKKTLLCLMLLPPAVFAAPIPLDFPLPPRVSLWGTVGESTFAQGDAMIPLWGNANQIFFGDLTAKYGDDRAWLASAGFGGRNIFHDNFIFGAYVFFDYNRSPNSKYYTVFNPGIEIMTNEWDGHLNGYIPVGNKDKVLKTFSGAELGRNTMFFAGHAQFDSLFNLTESVGPGADLEAGYTSPYLMRTRVFAGGYYFEPKFGSNIRGVEAGFEVPLKYRWASAEVRDSYDNLNHNTLVLSLRLTFGGLDKTGAPKIQDRMLDVIPRHLGSLQSGDGIPSQKTLVNSGEGVLLQDNIWFFNPDEFFESTYDLPTTFQNCTFEHPCVGLNQTRINEINAIAPNANFFLSSGVYNNPDLGLAFNFHNGQNIFGRTANFSEAATGNERPLLTDSLFLEGNNTVSDLRIDGHSARNLETGGILALFQVGLLVRSFSPAGMVNVNNTEIMANSFFALNAMAVANNSNVAVLNLNNSTLISSQTDIPGSIAIGGGNLRTGGFNISNSSITVTNIDAVNNSSLAFGFVNNEAGLVSLANTSIAVNMLHGALAVGVLNNSSLGLGLGTITMNGLNISVNANDAFLVGGVLNQANNPEGVSANINLNQSTILVTSNNGPFATVFGVLTSGTGTASINQAAINVTGDSGSLAGLVVGGPTATMNFQNTTISINTSGTATGTPTQNAGILNDLGGNQCIQNGVIVPCIL